MNPLPLVTCILGAAYLWRSALRPRADEPHGKIDRSIRLAGAILLTGAALLYVLDKMGLLPSLRQDYD